MKINLKKKVVLAVLAGGMLCANGAFATTWCGSSSDATMWTSNFNEGRTTGANLILDGTASQGLTSISNGDQFYAGFGYSAVSGNNLSITAGNYTSNSFYAGKNNSNEGGASNNHIMVTGGSFTGGSIYGGDGGSHDGYVAENTIEINGGEFTNVKICGGNSGGMMSGGCVNNEVTIVAGTFHDGNQFYGYDSSYGGSPSGNTLNLKIKMGGKAQSVNHFEKINITLPSDIADGDIMLHTTDVWYSDTLIGVEAADGVTLKKR